MADHLTPEQRSWNMAQIKGKDTKPEVLVRSMLHRAGYRFRKNVKNLPGKPDIVLPKYKTVIFVHGCFWHRHKGCKGATIPKTRTEWWEKNLSAMFPMIGNMLANCRNLGGRSSLYGSANSKHPEKY